ncbi:MAG: hypothetical protein JW904_08965 [Spirochaetales bacterium]|nr:hypothetical protein [Spirochaetales bacterium]
MKSRRILINIIFQSCWLLAACLPFIDSGSLFSGKTIYVRSLSLFAVQHAVNQAADGDTIVLPKGQAEWNDSLSISSGIHLKGQGPGNTVISQTETDGSANLVYIAGKQGAPFMVSAITFTAPASIEPNQSTSIFIAGDCKNFRITNCAFTAQNGHSINIRGYTYGVIDHCDFLSAAQEVIVVFDGNNGEDSWLRPLSLGTQDAVFVEDCTFDFQTKGDHAITSNNGARYVFRYNTIQSSRDTNSTQVDAHGNYFADRGTFSVEIYNNTLKSGRSWYGLYIRGGTGVIFNNTFTGDYPNPIVFTCYRAFVEDAGTPCGYVACSWPAIDQIHDFHVWNNVCNEAPASVTVLDRGQDQLFVQKGRDYFETPLAGYTPFVYPHPLNK